MTKSVVVVGAGLMGLTTAYWLRRLGAQVRVIDAAEGPGLGTSFANGGMLTPSQANPWNAPGILRYAISTIGKKDSPFVLNPRTLPSLWRWGSAFIANSRPGPYMRNAERNFALGDYSHAMLETIEADLQGDYRSSHTGTVQLFRDEESLDGGFAIARQLHGLGLNAERIGKEQLAQLDPALTRANVEWVGGVYFPDDRSGDAYRFCTDLHRLLADDGVEFSFGTRVTAIDVAKGRITGLTTDAGPVGADAYVLAAASHSMRLLAPIGISIPVQPVKGYSVSIDLGREHNLRVPLVDTARKLAMTPLGDQLRLAGTAEFTGFDTTVDQHRIDLILRDATNIVPKIADVDPAGIRPWAGLRPVTPTGFPVLRRYLSNLFVNAGQGPLGWTFAAGSGAIVADMVMGRAHALSDNALVAEVCRA